MKKIFIFMLLALSYSAAASEESSEEESSVWGDISNMAESLSDDVVQSAEDISEGVAETYLDVANFSEQSLKQFQKDLDKNVNIITKTGYNITGLSVTVGLVPTVSFDVERVKEIDISEQIAIVNKLDGNDIMLYIIESLSSAHAMTLSGFKVESVSITLGLPPKTVVHFKKAL